MLWQHNQTLYCKITGFRYLRMKCFPGLHSKTIWYWLVWECIVLPCLQTQGTVTAVQLQTEAPVVTASGQQVQTLQVVVSPPACVSVKRQCYGLQVCMQQRGLSYTTHLCPVWFISALPACLYSSLNCMSLSTVCCVSGCPPVFMTVKRCLSRALPLLSKNKCPSWWGWKLVVMWVMGSVVQAAEEPDFKQNGSINMTTTGCLIPSSSCSLLYH